MTKLRVGAKVSSVRVRAGPGAKVRIRARVRAVTSYTAKLMVRVRAGSRAKVRIYDSPRSGWC